MKPLAVKPAVISKYLIRNLILEVTRRCNMNCEHCLRGESQDIDLSSDMIRALFKQISSIDVLTLTGGEPSLVPQTLIRAINIAKKFNVYVGGFYIATNAKEVSNKFITALLALRIYCNDDDFSSLDISNDVYHEKVSNENIKKLKALSFTHFKYDDKYVFDYRNGTDLISEGRSDGASYRVVSPFAVEIEEENQIDSLYLNCKGNLICDCNFSYDSQDKDDLIIGNVLSSNFNLKKVIKKYNRRFQ